MTKSNFVTESVIKGYLNGKSFDEISYENNIAKGSVFNIIHSWIDQIGAPDIDELREFSVMIRKSGITIKQCTQSFRFMQILANFGIRDELDSIDTEDILSKNRIKNDQALTSRDDFYYFIESIYNKSKSLGVKSTNIIGWMQDLFDFSSFLFESADNNTYKFDGDINQLDEFQELTINKKRHFKKSADTKDWMKVQIPLISEIGGYIEQKKLIVENLDIHNKKLQQEIEELKVQENAILTNITNLKKKESLSLTYLNWFDKLRKELLNIYGIKLEKEFSNFVKVFTDFRDYDYDAHQIVQEYKQIESLRYEKESIQGILNSIVQTRDNLLNEIESLEERKSYSKQSLDTLLALEYAGFGLKELKQLKNIVSEIAVANGIDYDDAGIRFTKDIENQYDAKLGFETKINELEAKLKKLEEEEPQYKEYLQSKDIVNRALPYLYRYSVTDEDIINMSDVVTAYLNGHITFKPNEQTENIVDENKFIRKSYYWRSFINEIKNLGDINSQIANQRSYLETIKKEIDDLNSQRQKLNEQTLSSGRLLNSIIAQFPYFMESIKQIMLSIKETNKMLIAYQPLFFINVTIKSHTKDDDNNINPND